MIRISIISVLLFFCPIFSLGQADSISNRSSRNIYGFYIGIGRSAPILMSDYDYVSNKGNCWGFGLIYERKLNKRISITGEIQFMNYLKSGFSITENSSNYKDGDYLEIYINPHGEFSFACGPKFDFKLNKKESSVIGTEILLGYGRSNSDIQFDQKRRGFVYKYNEMGSDKFGYGFVRFKISKKINPRGKVVITPFICYNLMLNSIASPHIVISSAYYKTTIVNFKYNSIFFGLQFEF